MSNSEARKRARQLIAGMLTNFIDDSLFESIEDDDERELIRYEFDEIHMQFEQGKAA